MFSVSYVDGLSGTYCSAVSHAKGDVVACPVFEMVVYFSSFFRLLIFHVFLFLVFDYADAISRLRKWLVVEQPFFDNVGFSKEVYGTVIVCFAHEERLHFAPFRVWKVGEVYVVASWRLRHER